MMTVDGAVFRYVLSGQADGRTLVLLNGGMNTLEMWIDYVDALSTGCRVLLFDYPQQLRTNQELVTACTPFSKSSASKSRSSSAPSDGGMVSQIYVQKYPGEGRRTGADLDRRHGCRNAQEPEKKVLSCAGHAVVHEALQL